MDEKQIKIAVGITGSMDKLNDTMEILRKLVEYNYDVTVFCSDSLNSRQNILDEINQIINKEAIIELKDAESFGPQKHFDLMLISPLTGNSLSKLANAITDNAVLMAAKGILRNNKPIVLAISTNDALGLNGNNLMKLLVTKNIYFVPFYQDDPIEKPNSLIADYTKVIDTMIYALKGKQLQPIILARGREVDKK